MADLFDIVVARKLSGGGGGGGSSDFSTATVTINSNAAEYSLGLPWIDPDNTYLVGGLGSAFLPTGTPVTVPLYKGRVDAYFLGGNYTTVTTTGNATYDSGGGFVTITGDCTITIS